VSTRPLILCIAAALCAGALGAQGFNAVPALTFGPQTISSSSGETVTVDFGLTTLVHGPYTLVVLNLNSPGATITLNGTEIFGHADFSLLEISTPVTLSTANTLQVTFKGGGRGSALIVSIAGWEYMYANAYSILSDQGVVPDAYPSGSLDWTEKGAVTSVMNQGTSCPASWAFSTAGVVEGYTVLNTGTLPTLSEQQLLDCSGAPTCFLGNTAMATEYALGAGLTIDAAYPYTGRRGGCKVSSGPYKITTVKRVAAGSENALGAAVDIEPVSIVINGNWFSSYISGVANPDCESQIPVFASALLVGYGEDAGTPYWKVKNSLGTSWGESGYFRIVRNQNKCGIADYGLYVE
jgi:hypothetical protein